MTPFRLTIFSKAAVPTALLSGVRQISAFSSAAFLLSGRGSEIAFQITLILSGERMNPIILRPARDE